MHVDEAETKLYLKFVAALPCKFGYKIVRLWAVVTCKTPNIWKMFCKCLVKL